MSIEMFEIVMTDAVNEKCSQLSKHSDLFLFL